MTKDEALKLALKALDVVKLHFTQNRHVNEAITAIKEALAQPEQEPVGDEWTPCMKLPVVVHVRKQRPSESHVSTREGITPVKPDDLIMRGVSGEEYPIGRAIFEQTYSLDTAPPLPVQATSGWSLRYVYFDENGIPLMYREPEERNFCQRCGKRTADLTTIHTCTPPEKNA
jgi:hypothetical protein